MLFRFQFVFILPLILFISSCAVIDDKQRETQNIIQAEGRSAWQLSGAEQRAVSSNRAVQLLLTQADELMSVDNFEQAGDKLERLVRIEPQFAQAWSRLAWMALKNGQVKRSQQLAQRSNSYSRQNSQLKILNWSFIQQAGELLNDIDLVEQAQRMITKLSAN